MMTDFADRCVITRKTGKKDKWDNPIEVQIYDGDCLYVAASNSIVNGMVVLNRPKVFLPTDDVLVNVDDAVSVTTRFGRNIVSVVEAVRDIRFQMLKREVTRLELKQASEK